MEKIEKLPPDERQNMSNVCGKLIWDKVNELVEALNDLRERT